MVWINHSHTNHFFKQMKILFHITHTHTLTGDEHIYTELTVSIFADLYIFFLPKIKLKTIDSHKLYQNTRKINWISITNDWKREEEKKTYKSNNDFSIHYLLHT